MILGIRFPDNDFTQYTKAFMEVFVLPTFIEREPGHKVTHLTSAMVVELFNTHMPYLHRFMSWYYDTNHMHHYPGKANRPLHELPLHNSWLQITEMNVYWDSGVNLLLSNSGATDHDFVWTEGRQVHIS